MRKITRKRENWRHDFDTALGVVGTARPWH